ncbi:hypothetical protein E2C01_100527 [Portunus trituberculatus]|uniref:Uncharacterized protein n=1 Tax=Portunus trituberculatus TaxID=210409 RepID=A0A5B7KDS2_PORTR|nr:hypothetical protein [Portunus trituberculatus]
MVLHVSTPRYRLLDHRQRKVHPTSLRLASVASPAPHSYVDLMGSWDAKRPSKVWQQPPGRSGADAARPNDDLPLTFKKSSASGLGFSWLASRSRTCWGKAGGRQVIQRAIAPRVPAAQ